MIHCLFIIVSVCLGLYSALGLEVTVEQQYLVSPPDNPTPPAPITVTVPEGSFAIDAMYQAAQVTTNPFDPSQKDYDFSGDYYGEFKGWQVTKYGSVSNDDATSNYWMFYIEIYGQTISPNVGVSLVELCGVTKIIFQYEHYESTEQKVEL